jgi:hypothetical protein
MFFKEEVLFSVTLSSRISFVSDDKEKDLWYSLPSLPNVVFPDNMTVTAAVIYLITRKNHKH